MSCTFSWTADSSWITCWRSFSTCVRSFLFSCLRADQAVRPADGVAERPRDAVGGDFEGAKDPGDRALGAVERARAERDRDQDEREQHQAAHDDPALEGTGATRGIAGGGGALDRRAQDREADGPVARHCTKPSGDERSNRGPGREGPSAPAARSAVDEARVVAEDGLPAARVARRLAAAAVGIGLPP